MASITFLVTEGVVLEGVNPDQATVESFSLIAVPVPGTGGVALLKPDDSEIGDANSVVLVAPDGTLSPDRLETLIQQVTEADADVTFYVVVKEPES